jgi:hypothetical protein
VSRRSAAHGTLMELVLGTSPPPLPSLPSTHSTAIPVHPRPMCLFPLPVQVLLSHSAFARIWPDSRIYT